ncbi:MAG: plasmid pRiA4b ORF-3 family protein [Candidatus Eremiobacterota bacterium]
MSETIFIITETKPTTILKDFATFTEYLTDHVVDLSTVNEFMPKKILYELNQNMTSPLPDRTPGSEQTLYPLLHLFYHIVIAGKLFHKIPEKGNKFTLKPAERIQIYKDLTDTEKYFFLLETLWVDADWDKLQAGYFKKSPLFMMNYFMEYLSKRQPDEKIKIEKNRDSYFPLDMLYFWEYFLLYFSYFGFWEVIKDTKEQYSKHAFQAESITPTDFGVVMASILKEKRDINLWNLPYRRNELLEWKVIPGLPLADEEKISSMSPGKGKDGEPFFLPFVTFFPEGNLMKTLPRTGVQFIDGTYIFKVSLGKNLWRKISISAGNTLMDLHNSIQKAYDFDNDHLYSFFMDGKPWSKEKFTSPHEDEGICVDEVFIGELGLTEGQKILYLFDYGDEWRFQVQLEEIISGKTEVSPPVIIEKKGKNPEQYGFFCSENTD